MRPLACAVAVWLAACGLARAADREIAFVNHTGQRIDGIYISEDGANAWGWSVIDPRVIDPGQTITAPVGLPAGECVYDVRVTFASQAAQDWYKQADLCRFATLVFEPDPKGAGIILRTR